MQLAFQIGAVPPTLHVSKISLSSLYSFYLSDNQAWWCRTVIPVIMEAEGGGVQSQPGQPSESLA